MIPLDDLIAHYRLWERDCATQHEHALECESDRVAKEDGSYWAHERRVARDTVAWLETIKNRTAG